MRPGGGRSGGRHRAPSTGPSPRIKLVAFALVPLLLLGFGAYLLFRPDGGSGAPVACGEERVPLSITASPQEYDDYVELLIQNPRLGHTYKAYFGDIYQLDPRLLPEFDYVTLFHVGEFRTPDNDSYGALTDLEMMLLLADKVKPGGEILFYTGSFAYDKAQAVAAKLVKVRPFEPVADYKTLKVYRKRT